MKIGRVAASVVSTIKSPAFENRRVLLVDLLNPDFSETGKYIICVDTVDAGIGDPVLVLDEGNSARQILELKSAPIRSVIVGIIDDVNEE